MNALFTTAIALVTSLTLAACQPRGTEAGAEADYGMPDFAAMNEAYGAAINAADAEAVGMLYAEDAVSMPPNAPALVGRAAIVADAEGDFATMTPNLSSRSEGFYSMGDTAVEWGTYLFTGILEEPAITITEEGKYVAIWRLQPDGSWRIVRDIWNSNAPLDTGGESPAQ